MVTNKEVTETTENGDYHKTSKTVRTYHCMDEIRTAKQATEWLKELQNKTKNA